MLLAVRGPDVGPFSLFGNEILHVKVALRTVAHACPSEHAQRLHPVTGLQIPQRTEYFPTAGARRLLSSFTRSLPPPDLRATESGPAIAVYEIMKVHKLRILLPKPVLGNKRQGNEMPSQLIRHDRTPGDDPPDKSAIRRYNAK